VRIERSEIVDALAALILDGLAKAYLLSPFEPFSTVVEGVPPLDIIEQDFQTYFYVHEKRNGSSVIRRRIVALRRRT